MSKWIDIGVREAAGGTHYLLQMKVRKSGRKIFRNRKIDQHPWSPFYTLFHGFQEIEKKILVSPKPNK